MIDARKRGLAMGVAVAAMAVAGMAADAAQAASPPRLLQAPVMSASHVAFVSGGDLWVAPRAGGKDRKSVV